MQLARYTTLLLSLWSESAKSPSLGQISDTGPPPALSQPRRAMPLPLLLLLPRWLRLGKLLGAESHAMHHAIWLSPGKLSCFAFIAFFLLMNHYCFLTRLLLFSALRLCRLARLLPASPRL